MTTRMQDAIGVVMQALVLYEWEALQGVRVHIDDKPGKWWEASTLATFGVPVLQLVRGPRTFKLFNRAALWTGQPTVAVGILRYMPHDNATGEIDQAAFDEAELVTESLLPIVRDALQTDRRFTLVECEQPVGYDEERMLEHVYVSQVAFVLQDMLAL